MAQRYDLSTLKPAKKMPDGRLVVDAHLTRTGVFAYRNPDGSTRLEYRSHEEVSRADSLETLALAPVANDHPSEPVTAKNARKYAVGSVGEGVRMDGDHVTGRLVVHDQTTIEAMQAGKRQVSCGYECDLVEEPGIAPNGERYDAYQTNIVYNHVAIVDVGRAGTARVRMDAAVMCGDDDPNAGARAPDPKRTGSHVDRKDSVMNLEQALAALNAANEKIGAEKARADAAERTLQAEKDRATKLEADRDILKSRLDAAEKERKDAVDGAPAKVRARVELETKAGRVLGGKVKRADGAEVELAAAGDREIKLAVIKHVENVDCDVDAAGQKRPELYVDARYDAAIARADTSEQVFRGANEVIDASRAQTPAPGSRADGGAAAGSADAARQKAAEENQKQHATYLAGSAK